MKRFYVKLETNGIVDRYVSIVDANDEEHAKSIIIERLHHMRRIKCPDEIKIDEIKFHIKEI